MCFFVDKGGDPETVRKSQRERYSDVSLVDRVLELDEKWRQGWCIFQVSCNYCMWCLVKIEVKSAKL